MAKGKRVKVIATETRPRLQGAKLTVFELLKDGFDVTLITDNTAGLLARRGEIDLVIVGADRVAANGDAVNKIGTYEKALVAQDNGIPFYVAAPTSTFDARLPRGDDAEIEERDPDEILHINGHPIAPPGCRAENPVFDVTPARLITGYITEVGYFEAGQLADLWHLIGA